MCIGIPMQVREVQEGRALCADDQDLRWIDTRLVEPPAPGDWLLVFLDAAREAIGAERARQVRDALSALRAAERGELPDLDRLFADLVEREPALPEHLRSLLPAKDSVR